MHDVYQQILKQYWGYNDFRGIQRQIIESIGSGHDTLGLMPTGGGKSITFQVPALAQEGVCVVITPLVALMKDQVRHLRNNSIRATSLHAGMSREQIIIALDNCILGDYKFLYVSPERLESDLFQEKLRHMKVCFICVDEAHCISQWGYDFRPSYLQIRKIRRLLPAAPVLALTASATPEVTEDIQKQLEFKEERVFRMSFERKNLAYRVVESYDKIYDLDQLIQRTKGSTIIYTRNRKQCHEISEHLQKNGHSATYYHAGLDNQEKELRQILWQNDEIRIMVATNAFGMGIDKPDVRQVIHIEIPDSIESYYQEAGRAGRDGAPAISYLIYSNKDIANLRRRVSENFPEKEYIKTVYEHLCYFYQIAEGFGQGIRREFNIGEFCYNFHHFPVQVHSALNILTKCGYLEYTDADEGVSRLMFILTRDQLYKLNEQEKQADLIIRTVLRKYTGLFIDYAYIDEKLIATLTGLTPLQVYSNLIELNKKNIVRYIPRKNIPHISFPIERISTERLHIPHEIYEDRKKTFEERIEAIIAFVEKDLTCRNKTILSYFGEKKEENCGQCDVCTGLNNQTLTHEEREYAKRQIAILITNNPTMVFDVSIENIDKKNTGEILQEMMDEGEIALSPIGIVQLTKRGNKKYQAN